MAYQLLLTSFENFRVTIHLEVSTDGIQFDFNLFNFLGLPLMSLVFCNQTGKNPSAIFIAPLV